jgi:Uma2 family endonuclease
MKAVMSQVPEDILTWRRRTGADRWDEMWEGVLHMTPSPTRDHQDLEYHLESWLRSQWGKPNRCLVYHQRNVAEANTWPNNYRIPDLVLLTPARFAIDHNEYLNGGPDVVVEIYSPGDESYEKLAFYAKVGVREIWIIDRDSRRPELYVCAEGACELRAASENGWLLSEVTGIELQAAANNKLAIRLTSRPETVADLP